MGTIYAFKDGVIEELLDNKNKEYQKRVWGFENAVQNFNSGR